MSLSLTDHSGSSFKNSFNVFLYCFFSFFQVEISMGATISLQFWLTRISNVRFIFIKDVFFLMLV